MKSVQIETFSEDASRVLVKDVPVPSPAPGQVLVRMQLAPVNPSDLNFVRGNYYHILKDLLWNRGKDWPDFDPGGQRAYPKPPYSLGMEGMGVVEANGGGLLGKRLLGKRVAVSAGPPNGTWQDYTLVDAKRAVAVPDNVLDSTAAMYFINPLSAYAMVRDVLGVKAGQWLIQDAAGSALAASVIRMSKVYGFRTINLVRSEEHRETLRALGADVVVVTDSENLMEAVAQATGGKGADYAMDCIGGPLAADIMQCLTEGGHMVLYGTLSEQDIAFHPRQLMMRYARITGFFAGAWLASKKPWQLLGALRAVGKLAQRGVFDSEVQAEYPLDQAAQAIEHSLAPGRSGKVMLRIGGR